MVIVVLTRAVKVMPDIFDAKGLTITIESLAFIFGTPLHQEVVPETWYTDPMACNTESDPSDTH
jgi:hypothetical protein